jgi:hypothetical protein
MDLNFCGRCGGHTHRNGYVYVHKDYPFHARCLILEMIDDGVVIEVKDRSEEKE